MWRAFSAIIDIEFSPISNSTQLIQTMHKSQSIDGQFDFNQFNPRSARVN